MTRDALGVTADRRLGQAGSHPNDAGWIKLPIRITVFGPPSDGKALQIDRATQWEYLAARRNPEWVRGWTSVWNTILASG